MSTISKSKPSSYRDIISTGSQSNSKSSEARSQLNPSSAKTDSDQLLEPSMQTWSDFFLPVNGGQPYVECEGRIGNGYSESSASGDEGNCLFQITSDQPEDFGAWSPSSPLPGASRPSLFSPQFQALPPPAMYAPPDSFSTLVYAGPEGSVEPGTGGVDAAQEAADTLVEFVRQHPELRGCLWNRLRTEFADCV